MNRACFPKEKTPEFTKMGEIHELFVLAFFLVWFAGATPESSKSVKKCFDTFRQFSRRAKNVKNRQKASKSFSTLFDNFRAAPFFRPLLGGSD